MTTSELITKLQKHLVESGDLPVGLMDTETNEFHEFVSVFKTLAYPVGSNVVEACIMVEF